MRYVLDTDVAIEYLRGNLDVAGFLSGLPDLSITTITLAELFYGVYKSQNPVKHENKLYDFLSGVKIICSDGLSCRNYGRLKAVLERQGKAVDDFDLMIAGICLSNGCTLITRNLRHYSGIEGLNVKSI